MVFLSHHSSLPTHAHFYDWTQAKLYSLEWWINFGSSSWDDVRGFVGVAVITSALHAEGLGFEPRTNLYFSEPLIWRSPVYHLSLLFLHSLVYLPHYCDWIFIPPYHLALLVYIAAQIESITVKHVTIDTHTQINSTIQHMISSSWSYELDCLSLFGTIVLRYRQKRLGMVRYQFLSCTLQE